MMITAHNLQYVSHYPWSMTLQAVCCAICPLSIQNLNPLFQFRYVHVYMQHNLQFFIFKIYFRFLPINNLARCYKYERSNSFGLLITLIAHKLHKDWATQNFVQM
jgi:hypothetical protein